MVRQWLFSQCHLLSSTIVVSSIVEGPTSRRDVNLSNEHKFHVVISKRHFSLEYHRLVWYGPYSKRAYYTHFWLINSCYNENIEGGKKGIFRNPPTNPAGVPHKKDDKILVSERFHDLLQVIDAIKSTV